MGGVCVGENGRERDDQGTVEENWEKTQGIVVAEGHARDGRAGEEEEGRGPAQRVRSRPTGVVGSLSSRCTAVSSHRAGKAGVGAGLRLVGGRALRRQSS